uniref:GTPase Der n=1 Tax=Physcomitrium patens TaxID=3218 RepID=A0A7I4C3S4_PHYPA
MGKLSAAAGGAGKRALKRLLEPPIDTLSKVLLVGRPNVGKSALFNRLTKRREALVYNTPDSHVTRDVREGVAKLGDMRFRVMDTAGLETDAEAASVLYRTAGLTAAALRNCQIALFLVDGRSGVQPLDAEVGKWLRKLAPNVRVKVLLNKAEGMHDDASGSLMAAMGEAYSLGFGTPVAISAESGLGLADLYEDLRPWVETAQEALLAKRAAANLREEESAAVETELEFRVDEPAGSGLENELSYKGELSSLEDISINSEVRLSLGDTDEFETKLNLNEENEALMSEAELKRVPMQLAIAGRPNVGKSTLLNSLLMEERVLTGPEPGLTRDSIRVEFEYENQKIFLVDTAGWMQRKKLKEGPAALSAMNARRNVQRAHVVTLVLDAQEIAETKRSMRHTEAALAQWVVQEGRGLVVVVNKMDLLAGSEHARLRSLVMKAVPEEITKLLPQVTGVPIVFVSALEGKGRAAVMRHVNESYRLWCVRLPTAKLNRWIRKVMSRHPKGGEGHGAKVRLYASLTIFSRRACCQLPVLSAMT